MRPGYLHDVTSGLLDEGLGAAVGRGFWTEGLDEWLFMCCRSAQRPFPEERPLVFAPKARLLHSMLVAGYGLAGFPGLAGAMESSLTSPSTGFSPSTCSR